MARIGWFDSELDKLSWFEPELNGTAWFDSELIDLASDGSITGSVAVTQTTNSSSAVSTNAISGSVARTQNSNSSTASGGDSTTTITISGNTTPADTYTGCTDAMIKELAPTTSHGTGTANTDFEISNWSASDRQFGLIRFEALSNIPAGATITAAKWKYWPSYTNATIILQLHRCLRNWVEGQATWNQYSSGNNWGTAGALNSSDKSATLSGSSTWTVAENQVDWKEISGAQFIADVQDMVNTPGGNNGWILDASASAAYSTYCQIPQRERAGSFDHRHILEVTYELASGVTGTVVLTQTLNTDTISGSVAISGTVARTQALNTRAGNGTVSISGAHTRTQNLNTDAVSGNVAITGTLTRTQALNTRAGNGTVAISGTAAVTQALNTDSVGATVLVSGTSATSQGNTVNGSGTITASGISGSVADTQVINSMSAVATNAISGSSSASQKQASTVVATISCSGSAAVTQTKQTGNVAASVSLSGSLARTQNVNNSTASATNAVSSNSAAIQRDILSAISTVAISGTFARTQAINSATISGSVNTGIAGTVAAVQRDSISTTSATITISGNTTPADTYQGVTDQQIYQADPTTVYNGVTTSDFELGIWAASSESVGLLRFEALANIPTGATITAASWKFWPSYTSATIDLKLQRVKRAWVEGQATWNQYSTGNNWSTAGGSNTTNDVYAATSATVNWTVAESQVDWKVMTSAQFISDVQDMVNTPSGNQGWRLSSTSGVGPYCQIPQRDREFSFNHRHILSVSYTLGMNGSVSITGTVARTQTINNSTITGTNAITGSLNRTQNINSTSISGTNHGSGTGSVAVVEQIDIAEAVAVVMVSGAVGTGLKDHTTGTATVAISGSASLVEINTVLIYSVLGDSRQGTGASDQSLNSISAAGSVGTSGTASLQGTIDSTFAMATLIELGVRAGEWAYEAGYSHNIAATRPTVEEGDLIVLCLVNHEWMANTITWPTGFTQRMSQNIGSAHMSYATKPATASEPSTYTVSVVRNSDALYDNSKQMICIAVKYRDTTNPITGQSISTSDGATPLNLFAPAVTATAHDTVISFAAVNAASWTNRFTFSTGGDFVEIAECNNDEFSAVVSYKEDVAGGAIGTYVTAVTNTVGTGGVDSSGVMVISLKASPLAPVSGTATSIQRDIASGFGNSIEIAYGIANIVSLVDSAVGTGGVEVVAIVETFETTQAVSVIGDLQITGQAEIIQTLDASYADTTSYGTAVSSQYDITYAVAENSITGVVVAQQLSDNITRNAAEVTQQNNSAHGVGFVFSGNATIDASLVSTNTGNTVIKDINSYDNEDWIRFSETLIIRKVGGGGLVSLQTATDGSDSNGYFHYTWGDGDLVPSTPEDDGSSRFKTTNIIGEGITVTLPAGLGRRIATFFVGNYNNEAAIRFTISDASSSPVIINLPSSIGIETENEITVAYQASSLNTVLTAELYCTNTDSFSMVSYKTVIVGHEAINDVTGSVDVTQELNTSLGEGYYGSILQNKDSSTSSGEVSVEGYGETTDVNELLYTIGFIYNVLTGSVVVVQQKNHVEAIGAVYSEVSITHEAAVMLAEIWQRLELDKDNPVVITEDTAFSTLVVGNIIQQLTDIGVVRASGLPTAEGDAILQIKEVWQRLGLDPNNPIIQSEAKIASGDIVIDIGGTNPTIVRRA